MPADHPAVGETWVLKANRTVTTKVRMTTDTQVVIDWQGGLRVVDLVPFLGMADTPVAPWLTPAAGVGWFVVSGDGEILFNHGFASRDEAMADAVMNSWRGVVSCTVTPVAGTAEPVAT